jgi:ATP-binding cassette, subfamily B, bacterial
VVGGATAIASAVIFYLGGMAVLNGTLTLGDVVLFLAYLQALYSPVHTAMSSAEGVQYAAGSARRVLEVLESEPEVQDRRGARELTLVRGRVVFEGVSFAYEPGRLVLQDISFEAFPGQTVALVGRSGAGKTTLASLLPRFYDPVQGRILLDGHDLRDVTLASLRKHVALVLQEPFLFPVSIADNIAYGRPDASPEQILAAAVAANAHEFIEALPDGYNTVLGERGARLSGGQRQRISIARALLKDAPLLILDEPTSALDTHSERLLLQALRRLMAGRTTLIIAHRLSTIRGADQILVLDDGHIVERGNHRQLKAHGGHYARLMSGAHSSRISVLPVRTG